MKSKDARSLDGKTQENNRIRAVLAVLKGHTQVAVAEIIGVTRQTVGQWMAEYRKKVLKDYRPSRKVQKRRENSPTNKSDI